MKKGAGRFSTDLPLDSIPAIEHAPGQISERCPAAGAATIDAEKAKTISDLSQTIINTAKTMDSNAEYARSYEIKRALSGSGDGIFLTTHSKISWRVIFNKHVNRMELL